MMNLKSRLTTLQSQTDVRPLPKTKATLAPVKGVPEVTRDRLARLRSGRALGLATKPVDKLGEVELAEKLGGVIIAEGLIKIIRKEPLVEKHGAVPLDQAIDVPALPGEEKQTSQRQVYIDTETTGLSGGSGTVAFLVGIAVLDKKHLITTQWLMTRFSAEEGMLVGLMQTLSASDQLVSYNGKSFDIPLLVSRCRMQGIRSFLQKQLHLDLLHPVRRLFKNSWPDCRLTTVEQRLIGFSRTDDLPGSEAPQAWFDYVRMGIAGRLIQIVEHNYLDILSLPTIHAELAKTIDRAEHPQIDFTGLARWRAKTDETSALALLESREMRLDDSGRQMLAVLLRRSGRWDEAVKHWHQLAKSGCEESIENLAKYYEHQLHDYETALEICTRLQETSASQQRVRRLQGKLEMNRVS